MFGFAMGGSPHYTKTFTSNGSWVVPGNVALVRRLVLKAPAGSGGAISLVGNAGAGGGGGGGGEVAVALNVPVTPGSTVTFSLTASGSPTVSVTHPTLGALTVQKGIDGSSAASTSVSGAGGDGGGPDPGIGGLSVSAGKAAGNAGGNAGAMQSDTATWAGVTVDRYSGGGGGSGATDNDLADSGSPVSGGTGGNNSDGDAGTAGVVAGPGGTCGAGGGGGGIISVTNAGNLDTLGGRGFAEAPPAGLNGFLYLEL